MSRPVAIIRAQVAERIASVRRRKGLTQPDLAQQIGVKHSTQITHIESGRVDLRVSTLLRIADALQVEPGELLPSGDDEPDAIKDAA